MFLSLITINVLYFPVGPLQVVITQPNKGPVGKEMYVLPGSTTALECSADCYPVCSYSWMYNAKLLATDASLLFKPETPPNKGVLTCVAYNSVTKDSSSATTTAFIAGKQMYWCRTTVVCLVQIST